MANLEETKANMLNAERTIDLPAYQYVANDTMSKEISEWERREKEKTGAVRIFNRTKN